MRDGTAITAAAPGWIAFVEVCLHLPDQGEAVGLAQLRGFYLHVHWVKG
jgi:hypothetical protein